MGLEALEPRLLLSGDGALGLGYQQAEDASGLVVIDAAVFDERIDRGGQSWEVIELAGATDGDAVQALPDNRVSYDTGYADAAPELQFAVDFAHTGTHYVWVLGQGTHNRHAMSLHVGVDGQETAGGQAVSPLPRDSFAWVSSIDAGGRATLDVAEEGRSTLNLWMHQDGVIVDRILLTTDETFTPTGDGPGISERIDPSLGTITGVVWHDLNADGEQGADEPGLADVTVYLDHNGNGELEDDEPSTLTDAEGVYTFEDMVPGDYAVHIVQSEGWVSATPDDAAARLVTSDHTLLRIRDAVGGLQETFDVPYPDEPLLSHAVRDVTSDADGNIWIFNGTGSPRLTRYEPSTGTFSHWSFDGWNTSTNSWHSGVAVHEHYVFASDSDTSFDARSGLIRFDMRDGSWERFSDGTDYMDVVMGLDGLVYGALAGSSGTSFWGLTIFDPTTLEELGGFATGDGVTGTGLAVDEDGYLYTGSLYEIRRLDPEGELIDVIPIDYEGPLGGGGDMTILRDGRIARMDREGVLHITDRQRTVARRLDYDLPYPHEVFVGWLNSTAGEPVAVSVPFGGEVQADFAQRRSVHATSAPQLAPEWDHGHSATDGVTNINNADNASRLFFETNHSIPGATLRLYADGMLIGTAVVGDTTTMIATDGETVLADGTYRFTVTQEVPGEPTVVSGETIITIDTDPPAVSFDEKITYYRDPVLSGTIDDGDARLTVTIDDETFEAVHGRFDAWELDLRGVTELDYGTPTLILEAMDVAGNITTLDASGMLEVRPPDAVLSGALFEDAERVAAFGPENAKQAGWIVFIDEDRNGQFDAGEPRTVSDEDGYYEFTDLPDGQYYVTVIPPESWFPTIPPHPDHPGGGKSVAPVQVRNEREQAVLEFSSDSRFEINGTRSYSDQGYRISAAEFTLVDSTHTGYIDRKALSASSARLYSSDGVPFDLEAISAAGVITSHRLYIVGLRADGVEVVEDVIVSPHEFKKLEFDNLTDLIQVRLQSLSGNFQFTDVVLRSGGDVEVDFGFTEHDVVLAPSADATVADIDRDGTFETLIADEDRVTARWQSFGTKAGEYRGILEFDLSRVSSTATILDTQLRLELDSGGLVDMDVYVYAADGAVTLADGDAEAQLLTTWTRESGIEGIAEIELDAEILQSFIGGHIGIRLQAPSSGNTGISAGSTRALLREPARLVLNLLEAPPEAPTALTPVADATVVDADIDGAFDHVLPEPRTIGNRWFDETGEQRPVLEFDLRRLPAGAPLQDVRLVLDVRAFSATAGPSASVELFAFGGDGRVRVDDGAAAGTLIGTADVSRTGRLEVALDAETVAEFAGGFMAIRLHNPQKGGDWIEIASVHALEGYPPVLLLDAEEVPLEVHVPQRVLTRSERLVATVTRRGGQLDQALSVGLTAGDPDLISVPPTLIIPAGEASADFLITLADGAREADLRDVSLTASSGDLLPLLPDRWSLTGTPASPCRRMGG